MRGYFIAIITMVGVEANLSTHCVRNVGDTTPIIGNLAEYKSCGNFCTCSVFQLLCIEPYLRTDKF